MTDRIAKIKKYLEDREHRAFRRDLTKDELIKITTLIRDDALSYMARHTLRLKLFLEMEKPVILPDTQMYGLRTIKSFPDIYSPEELLEIKKSHYVHEKGKVTNVTWSVKESLTDGLEGRRALLMSGEKKDPEFVFHANETIDILLSFADKYAKELVRIGKKEEADTLSRAIRTGAKTMVEAFMVFRILHFAIWCSDCYHNTIGRFDQWALPFYLNDLKAGIETKESALEKIEDFFLSFNWDSDLYYSLAWGDNGQSLVLGGILPNGENGVNDLTELSLIAAKELRQIDPKINLRVDKNTPLALFELATELTKIGLGFPQYSNDDVVIPCLEHWGYDTADARDYCIAACWEFIIPENSMDIVNINGLPIAKVVRDTITQKLECSKTFDQLLGCVKTAIKEKAVSMTKGVKNFHIEPAPILSILMQDSVKQGKDISYGGKYNNLALHGTGLSCGADQLAAVKDFVYDKKITDKKQLLTALENDFKNSGKLKFELRNNAPKMGRDQSSNELGNTLLNYFADALEGIKTDRGGIWRAGTGSAMYYVWHSQNLGATSDGRGKGKYIPCNFSPSLFITKTGALSALVGFAPKALLRTSNGGPMTLELHDNVFKDEENIMKVAQLVRAYIKEGGHQLQLNAVNREKLRDAQAHPENHPDLIVRVWGWSGHFIELDKCYQDQVLSRVEFGVD